MKLGLMLGYWTKGPDDATEAVLAAEDAGFHSVWTAEAYGSDAFTT
ncbi:MAG TPA: LLM class F420-dependent oxidoreductase, partial [Mycobacteriales bacterium]|nr:LLM class F420-dependent oxidoreductase [Mycobacteriales bacterium]